MIELVAFSKDIISLILKNNGIAFKKDGMGGVSFFEKEWREMGCMRRKRETPLRCYKQRFLREKDGR